jgi:double-strand break repair protein MRE11
LTLQVQSMIQQAMRDSPAAAAATQQQQQQQVQQLLLPLIRLRVDYSGFSTINSQRFGQKFVGKVSCAVMHVMHSCYQSCSVKAKAAHASLQGI